MRYPSKVDTWLAALLIVLVLGGLGTLVGGVIALVHGSIAGALINLGIGVFLLGLLGLVVYPVHYTLSASELKIRHGVMTTTIALKDISAAYPSKNPISSPALSLDRLRIDYDGGVGFAMISPRDKQAFLRDLADRAEHLSYADERVSSA
jgi:hypothetical protein